MTARPAGTAQLADQELADRFCRKLLEVRELSNPERAALERRRRPNRVRERCQSDAEIPPETCSPSKRNVPPTAASRRTAAGRSRPGAGRPRLPQDDGRPGAESAGTGRAPAPREAQ